MKQQKNKKTKLKERRKHIFKCDEPDLQESAIFKKIVAYQQKLLVRRIFLKLMSFFWFELYHVLLTCTIKAVHIFTFCN